MCVCVCVCVGKGFWAGGGSVRFGTQSSMRVSRTIFLRLNWLLTEFNYQSAYYMQISHKCTWQNANTHTDTQRTHTRLPSGQQLQIQMQIQRYIDTECQLLATNKWSCCTRATGTCLQLLPVHSTYPCPSVDHVKTRRRADKNLNISIIKLMICTKKETREMINTSGCWLLCLYVCACV